MHILYRIEFIFMNISLVLLIYYLIIYLKLTDYLCDGNLNEIFLAIKAKYTKTKTIVV